MRVSPLFFSELLLQEEEFIVVDAKMRMFGVDLVDGFAYFGEEIRVAVVGCFGESENVEDEFEGGESFVEKAEHDEFQLG